MFFTLVDHTQERPPVSHFQANDQKDVIKEEGIKEEEQPNTNKADETGTKLTAVQKEGVAVSENVVLKNQKVGSRGGKKKQGCC